MPVTQVSDINDRIIFTETMQMALKGNMGLMGSILVTQGAIAVAGTMPRSGAEAIGETIRIGYWGTLGPFEANAEGSSPTPKKVGQGYEDATIARASLAFEGSRWAQGLAAVAEDEDPIEVMAKATATEARRYMDSAMIASGSGSALVYDLYNASSPHYLTYSDVVTGKAKKLGDEQTDGIVAMVLHSLVAADLANQMDSAGRPILATPAEGSVPRVAGVPILMSDRMPLTGSTMGTVTHTGTGSATYVLAVDDATKLGPWDLVIETLSTGECGTATIKFSVDGGNTWSAAITTSATGVATYLKDTQDTTGTVDSLVGNNGETGLKITFTSDTGDDLVDGDTYTSTANLCCESQIWLRGAGAYWYNEQALELKLDGDILEDTTIGAAHLYGTPHVYRRRLNGTRPGVLRIKTNARGFVG